MADFLSWGGGKVEGLFACSRETGASDVGGALLTGWGDTKQQKNKGIESPQQKPGNKKNKCRKKPDRIAACSKQNANYSAGGRN